MSDPTEAGTPAEIGPEAEEMPGNPPQNDGSPQNGGSAPASPRPAGPRVEAATTDVTAAADAAPLPGAHRGGFSREFTGPVAITIQSAPVEPGTEDVPDYTPTDWVAARPHARFGAWGLAFAILGLLVSFLVGWGFLLGIVAIIAGAVALRRGEPRGIAIWALALAALSILYSAGWLLWAASQGALALD
jgi:hypothetical protein